MKELILRPNHSEISKKTRSEGKMPQLYIIVGPSGVGKSSIIDLLIQRNELLTGLPAITDRLPRDNDRKSSVSQTEFDSILNSGEFLFVLHEHDNRYGTPRTLVESALESGKTIVMDYSLDHVQSLVEHLDLPSYVICVLPPKTSDQLQRLSSRPARISESKNFIHKLFLLDNRRKIYAIIINRNLNSAVELIEELIIKNQS